MSTRSTIERCTRRGREEGRGGERGGCGEGDLHLRFLFSILFPQPIVWPLFWWGRRCRRACPTVATGRLMLIAGWLADCRETAGSAWASCLVRGRWLATEGSLMFVSAYRCSPVLIGVHQCPSVHQSVSPSVHRSTDTAECNLSAPIRMGNTVRLEAQGCHC